MRLPVVRSVNEIIAKQGEASVLKTVDVLEDLSQAKGMKTEELDVIGELLSNMLGSLEVSRMQKEGLSQTEALNSFMKRVMGSIDKN